MSAQIEEFCFNHSPWRIDALGGLHDPSGAYTEPRIEVYLSELSMESGNPLSNTSLAEPNRHEVVLLNAGQMCLFTIGSVWINGVRVPPAKPPTEKTFLLTHEQFSFLRFDDAVQVQGTSQTLITPYRYKVGRSASTRLAKSWYYVALNPTHDVELVAIPSTVVFQTCAATSPNAIRHLLVGEIDKIIDPSSDFDPEEAGTYFVELFKDFRDGEAKAIANLRVDPVGNREYSRLHHGLTVDRVNQGATKDAPLEPPQMKFGLPFSNPVKLTAIGKKIPFDIVNNGTITKKFGFLVTEIVSLETQLVFDQLVISRKNDARQGKNAKDPNLQPGWQPPPKQPVCPPEPNLPVKSGPEPSNDLERLAIEASGGFDAIGLTEIKDQKTIQKYKSRRAKRSEYDSFGGSGTTGTARGNGSGVADIDLLPLQTPKVPITLNAFLESLLVLASQRLQFRTLATSPIYRQQATPPGIVNFLPRRIRGSTTWHLQSKESNAPTRGYIVAEIQFGGVFHYLIELERKNEVSIGVQHIRAVDGMPIDPNRLAQFMVDAAKHSGWGVKKYYKLWIFRTIVHPKTNRIDGLARSIRKVVAPHR